MPTVLVDRLPALLMEAAPLPHGARAALIALIAILGVILCVVLACALILRRRPTSPKRVVKHPAGPAGGRRPLLALETPPARRVTTGGAALQVASSAMACPSCTREYEATFEYCPRDARRLVPASEVQEKARGRGSVCADCHRAFDASVSACPGVRQRAPSPRRCTKRSSASAWEITAPDCWRESALSATANTS